MNLFELPPYALARLYMWHMPFNELARYSSVSHNSRMAAELALFSRQDTHSLRIQEKLLEQWAFQSPESLRKWMKNNLVSYLKRHISSAYVSFRYRFLGMIVLAAYHNVTLEIDDNLFAQLKKCLFAGAFQPKKLHHLHILFSYLNPGQISELSQLFKQSLQDITDYDYETALFHLSALAPRLDEKSLHAFIPLLIKGLSLQSEKKREYAIGCLRSFALKMTSKQQMRLCNTLLGSRMLPAAIYQSLSSVSGLLSASVRQTIVSWLLKQMRQSRITCPPQLIQCMLSWSAELNDTEQDELFLFILTNLKNTDMNVRIKTMEELNQANIPHRFLSRLIHAVSHVLLDKGMLCRVSAKNFIASHISGIEKKSRNKLILRLLTTLDCDKFELLETSDCLIDLIPVMTEEAVHLMAGKLYQRIISANPLNRVSIREFIALSPRLNELDFVLLSQHFCTRLEPYNPNLAPLLGFVKIYAERIRSTGQEIEFKNHLQNLWQSGTFFTRMNKPLILECLTAFFPAFDEQEVSRLTEEIMGVLDDERQLESVPSAVRWLLTAKDKLDKRTLKLLPTKMAQNLQTIWSVENTENSEELFILHKSVWQWIILEQPGLFPSNIIDSYSAQELDDLLLALAKRISAEDAHNLLQKIMENSRERRSYTDLKSPICLKRLLPLLNDSQQEQIITEIIIKSQSKLHYDRFQAVNYFSVILPLLSREKIEELLPYIYSGLSDTKAPIYIHTLKTLEWIINNTTIKINVDLTQGFNHILPKLNSEPEIGALPGPVSTLLLNNLSGEIDVAKPLNSLGLLMKCFIDTFSKLKVQLTPGFTQKEEAHSESFTPSI
ncbi:hypothetical protein Lqui_0505 [Legionella quinlivanii]|uniref:HEAT repeat protein n=1 Tax=Legionella quinlivanii TaxID=45073 RepID=A0A0W0Y3Q2_9GAMM|nr:hypothetical protein [Legionella quinlivanii]KTD51661.1 hypothetical protein Lqui_0505 [Legionella quinlivanii]MCW8450999.1 hypothetical protein [Legionella quinlivanii]SEF62268.1 hypothetical protein SAMN02746093_00644 [Legionella quinlivanii DSM 21216]STY10812.1 Uncharacterised protein [Legionella quinlivanii]